jgi:hypothetical protein
LVKPIDFKEGTQLQLQRRFFQTAPICIQWVLQIVHIYPNCYFLLSLSVDTLDDDDDDDSTHNIM